ncbi:MAG: oligosaccharide flippase family protein [Eubacterium sp.]|nr:oligosaccharide flippase family protein [Eubacterium sp.]
MKRLKYLLKNIGILSLSQFGTKLLSFFLVPLYTNILTTEDYGKFDLISTTVLLLVPLLTIDIGNAALRFALSDEEKKEDIFTISYHVVLAGNVIVFLGLFINWFFCFNQVIHDYSVFMFFMFFFSSFSSIFVSFSRGTEKIKEVAISGVLCTVVMISLNILFLVILKWGLVGFFIAHISASSAQAIYLFISCSYYKYINGTNDKKLRKQMINYSRPMVANSIAWWVNNASDRYIVIWFCGLAVNGVYSVGYKIPSILMVFQTIFNQAWTLSAVKDFDPDDKEGFFSKLYGLYNFGMVALCSLLILASKIMAGFLYHKEFYHAWKYVPFLLISIVFGSLSGYIGGIFTAVKDSKIFARSTVVGAVVNILLNLLFVNIIGALGAAIATAISYMVVWIIRMINSRKYIKLRLNMIRDVISYILLVVQAVVLLFVTENIILLYILESVILILIIVLYNKELRDIFNKLRSIAKMQYN